jgi:glycosyltransferase involved in cell wall biosynthesis
MSRAALARPILMTTDPVGGVWCYTLDLCRQLGKHGAEVALVSMGRRLTENERAQVRALRGVHLFESSFKLEWMTDPWRDVSAAGAWLERLSARIAPAIVHLNQFAHGALAWNTPCLIVGHSCVYSWFHAVKGSAPDPGWRKYQIHVARGLRAADAVTAPSRWLLERLQRLYGDFAAVAPIANGRDPARFAPGAKADFILTAGRLWDEAKNIASLDRVAPRLPWPIYAAGDGTSPDGSHARLEHLRLLGRLDPATLGAWMARAAIFALPARYEPFGLAALEAALSGCALVLGDIPSLREIWEDAALFVSADDADEMQAALAGLIADPTLRHRLAGAARRRALSYSAERMALAYLELYQNLRRSRLFIATPDCSSPEKKACRVPPDE